ncbi:MAG TPA: hypothetical protein VMP11_10635 [Verrucomicrobiae bacterium]|nr:hypothetical protein [Verrucomicrobiae bacterium]
MRYAHAKRLHNGDEVVDKTTGEIVKVLSVQEEPRCGPVPPMVGIEGVGTKQGHNHWQHTTIR